MPNKTFRLCPLNFDARGNFQFPNANGDILLRDRWTYYQPNNKWMRIGLRVLDRFPNDGWLNIWMVMIKSGQLPSMAFELIC